MPTVAPAYRTQLGSRHILNNLLVLLGLLLGIEGLLSPHALVVLIDMPVLIKFLLGLLNISANFLRSPWLRRTKSRKKKHEPEKGVSTAKKIEEETLLTSPQIQPSSKP